MVMNFLGLPNKNIALKPPQVLIQQGSDTFKYTSGVLVAAGTPITWVQIGRDFPRAKLYEPLDSFEIINNSGQPIVFWLNPTESYTVPSYMIKPIARRPVRTFGLQNIGIADTVAGEIIIHMRRLPPDVQPTVNVG